MAITPVTATGVTKPGKRGRKRAKQRGTTGLYQGKAGEFAAQQQPENYLKNQSTRSGLGTTGGSDYANWFNEIGVTDVYTGYQNALANNERLSLRDYMQQQQGLGGQLQREFQHYTANTDPQRYWAGHMAGTPEMAAAGASGFYHDFLANDLYNHQYSNYINDAKTRPNMTFDEFLNGAYDTASTVVSGEGNYQDSDGKGKGKGRKKGRR